MTPQEFIAKWKPVALTERASAQEHFLDLCKLFGHPTPAQDDPAGERFAFEKGAQKTGGGDGFADVWKKGFFAWEYKKKKRDLGEALAQLTRYAAALENPPLHVVCDTVRFIVETRWTNTVVVRHQFELEELIYPENLAVLRAVFHDPEALRPKQTRASLTKEAADKFQTISDRLQHRNPDREAVAHFVNQLVFCFFANSVKLLPEGLMHKLLTTASKRPSRSKAYFDKLFEQMESGGEFDLTEIRWFNGGLFDGRRALALEEGEINLLLALHSFRWDLIDPTIFGTLFERFLDPDKRAQIGAHYTDPAKIMLIVEPVVLRPLRAEWEGVKRQIETAMAPVTGEGKAPPVKAFEAARLKAEALRDAFVDRLCGLRILDPACGSGNFLYLALQSVKDLEYRALLECEALMLRRALPRVSPSILHGFEINPLAAELARTVIWIGDIQWGIKNAIHHRPEPILQKLDTIECRDALLKADGGEAEWPQVDFIVGNPPFLGGKLLRRNLGDETVAAMFNAFDGRVPREADLVCYWFVKAWEAMRMDRVRRAGLVATNSIRGGANRKALEPIAEAGALFEAWSDEGWTVDGAAVRVSLVCFSQEDEQKRLDGAASAQINADLSGAAANVGSAARLAENGGVAFMGDTKGGAFDVPGDLARSWLAAPLNPNGRPNSDVLKPWVNGLDVTRRPRDMWIVDFGWTMSEAEAAHYEEPFAYIAEHVKPEREKNARQLYRERWWRHVEPRPGMWAAIGALSTLQEHSRVKGGVTGDRRGTLSPLRGEGRVRGPKDNANAKSDERSGQSDSALPVECLSSLTPHPDPLPSKGRGSARYIVTPTVAKHRIFVWVKSMICADHQLIAIARDDDTTFGILHSRFHEAWSLRLGTWLGVGNDPRYTPTTTFETFAFPQGLTPDIPAKDYESDPRAKNIAAAAKRLDDLRNAWLNPADLVEIVPEVVPGYPDRILPKNVEAAAKLKKRTLTNLYNARPQWLADAHAALDRAVAAAYGWPADISTEDALAKLLALNLERAGKR